MLGSVFQAPAKIRLAPGAIEHLPLQLTAGGIDVVAAGAPHHRQYARVEQDFLEIADRVLVAALVLRTGKGIERNQVDLARQLAHKLDQLVRVFRPIVYIFQHRILERDRGTWTPRGVTLTGAEQFTDRILLV